MEQRTLLGDTCHLKCKVDGMVYMRSNNPMNGDLDSLFRAMGILNIFKIFALRKILITSIVTAFVEEKNEGLFMSSLLSDQQSAMTTGLL